MPKNIYPRSNPRGKINEVPVVVSSASKVEVVDPLATYQALAAVMGKRLAPCVLYTLLAVAHFQKTGERLPWWQFTKPGKQLL